jgi:hypothetical protein
MDENRNIFVSPKGLKKIFGGWSDLDYEHYADIEELGGEFKPGPIKDMGVEYSVKDGCVIATWTDGEDKTITHTKVFSPYNYLAKSINAFFENVSIANIKESNTDLTDYEEDEYPF